MIKALFKGPIHVVMTNEEKLIYKRIEEILWFDWDPIGINDTEQARDEYYSYLFHVFEPKREGANRDKIAKHLFKIETERMGLPGDIGHCRKAADKILSI